MKSNIKKKSRYGISILMIAIILMVIPSGMAAVTADRTIDSTTLEAGNSTNVTVVIQNDDVERSISLQETIPSGWTLTRGTDDAGINFKPSTNEWLWFTVLSGEKKTVIYEITAPSGAAADVYNIDGIITVNGSTQTVTGESTITVVNNTVITPTPTPTPALTNGSFDLTVNQASATVNVGTDALYTLTINNLDSTEDTYSLVTTEPNNVIVTLANNSVTVGPGGSADIEMTVNGSSIGDYVVSVTATSGSNTSSSKDVTTTTSIVETQTGVEDFNFDTNPSTMTINVGGSATYTLTVNNIGSAEDTYSLATEEVPNNATVDLASNSVTVGPGNSSDVALTVSGSVTGTYTVNVTATSNTNTSNVKSVTTTTDIVVNAPPSRSGSSSGGSSGGGTYPTFTATPVKTSNATAAPTVTTTTVVPTATITTVRQTEVVKETPIDMTTTKGAPGFEIVIAIGMLGAIYILRRMK